MDGLGEILKQKYDPKEAERVEFEKQVKISELQTKLLIDNARKKQGKKQGEKVNINMNSLLSK